MALIPKISNAAATAAANAVAALCNDGYLRIYSGTKPASADAALAGNTLLAELRFAATAAPAATDGDATFNSITQDSGADNTGTATFFRAFGSNGTSVVFDGSVGTSGCDLNLNSVDIQQNATVSVTSFHYVVNKG